MRNRAFVAASFWVVAWSLAPAAAEDAASWAVTAGLRYGIVPDQTYLTSGGEESKLDLWVPRGATVPSPTVIYKRNQNPAAGGFADLVVEEMPVAAIVNWFGITDVGDLLAGEHAKAYAVQWMGSLPNRDQLARQLSPLSMVRSGLPPILTVHGDADPIVPYDHAVRLHAALEQAGVPNQLHTIAGGSHGGFTAEQSLEAYRVIREFLARHLPAPNS